MIDCISKINNKEIDHENEIDVVMAMHNLTDYGDNYWETSGSSWHYYRDEPFIDNNGVIIDVPNRAINDSASFISKQKVTGQTGNNGTKDVQIMVPLKYVSNFWRTLEMPLINCEINIFFNLV